MTSGPQAYDADRRLRGVGATPGPPVTRRVSDTEAIRVDITGPEAFGDRAGTDLFAVVDQHRHRRRRQPGGAGRPTSTDLDDVMKRHARRRSPTSAPGPRASTARSRSTPTARSRLQSQLAETENIDLPKTIMRAADAADRLPGGAVRDGQGAPAHAAGLPALMTAAPTRSRRLPACSSPVATRRAARTPRWPRPGPAVGAGADAHRAAARVPRLPRLRRWCPADAGGLLFWLQSVAPDGPRFLAVSAASFFPDYAPVLPGAACDELGPGRRRRGAAVLPGDRAGRRRRRGDGEPPRAAGGQPGDPPGPPGRPHRRRASHQAAPAPITTQGAVSS